MHLRCYHWHSCCDLATGAAQLVPNVREALLYGVTSTSDPVRVLQLNTRSSPVKRDVVLVVSSAGGHLNEALCALSLVEADLHLVCNKNMLDNARFRKIHTVRDTQYNPSIHALNFLYGIWLFLTIRPDAMFSAGGPICLPFALLAKATRTKFVYLDTMARVSSLSNTGRIIEKYGLCDVFLCQWKSIAEQYESIEYCGTVFSMSDQKSDQPASRAA